MSRLDQLRQLAAAQPDDPFTHYGVALECMNLEFWDDARAALDRALALDPHYIAAHMQKARVELRTGQRAAAAACLQAGIAAAQARADRHAAEEMTKMLEALG
ncbi:MAG: tetratricopeptide repeat protein [Planctomycetota bacterium]